MNIFVATTHVSRFSRSANDFIIAACLVAILGLLSRATHASSVGDTCDIYEALEVASGNPGIENPENTGSYGYVDPFGGGIEFADFGWDYGFTIGDEISAQHRASRPLADASTGRRFEFVTVEVDRHGQRLAISTEGYLHAFSRNSSNPEWASLLENWFGSDVEIEEGTLRVLKNGSPIQAVNVTCNVSYTTDSDNGFAMKHDGTLVCLGEEPVGFDPDQAFRHLPTDCSTGAWVGLAHDGSIAVFGPGSGGPTNFPYNVPAGNDFKQVVVNYDTCLALRSDGSIETWGASMPNVPTDSVYTGKFIHVVACDPWNTGSQKWAGITDEGRVVWWGDYDTFMVYNYYADQSTGVPAWGSGSDLSMRTNFDRAEYSNLGTLFLRDATTKRWTSIGREYVRNIHYPNQPQFEDMAIVGFRGRGHRMALYLPDCDSDLQLDSCSANDDDDDDGIINSCDCYEGNNGFDSNLNGIGDNCESCPISLLVRDQDNDSVPDDCDVCWGYNDLIDSDKNGVPDCLEPDADSDYDGTKNGCDSDWLRDRGELITFQNSVDLAEPQTSLGGGLGTIHSPDSNIFNGGEVSRFEANGFNFLSVRDDNSISVATGYSYSDLYVDAKYLLRSTDGFIDFSVGYDTLVVINSEGNLESFGYTNKYAGDPDYWPAQNGDFVQVSLGYYGGIALRADGTAAPWSYDYSTNPPVGSRFTHVESGEYEGYAGILENGQGMVWGIDGSEILVDADGQPEIFTSLKVCQDQFFVFLRPDGSLRFVNEQILPGDRDAELCERLSQGPVDASGNIIPVIDYGIIKQRYSGPYDYAVFQEYKGVGITQDGNLVFWGTTGASGETDEYQAMVTYFEALTAGKKYKALVCNGGVIGLVEDSGVVDLDDDGIIASCDSDDSFIDQDGDGLEDALDPNPTSPWDNGIETDDQLWVVPGMNLQGAIDFVWDLAQDNILDITTINFEPGSYTGAIDLRGMTLTLTAGTAIYARGPVPTIFWDAQGADRHISNPGASLIEGFILTNGVNQSGGSIQCSDLLHTPTVRNCIITGCYATNKGGAISVTNGGSVTIQNCQIYGNAAGVAGGGLFTSSNSFSSLVGTTVCGNTPDQISGSWSNLGGNSVSVQCSADVGDGGDIPDPNPVQNADGTFTWYVGNNLQYPVMQDVLDAASPGDEIVVAAGLYVESISVDVPDLTIRPMTAVGALSADGGFQPIVLWNPTEGFDNENGHAIFAGPDSRGSQIGRPSEFTQLANGSIVPTRIPISGPGLNQEYAATSILVDMCNINYTDLNSMTRMQRGLAGSVGDDLAVAIWSRSIDQVGIRTMNSGATFSHCDITSSSGFGGGILVTGGDDSTSFVHCTVSGTWSGGQFWDGHPVHALTISGGRPMFTGCSFTGNQGGADAVIRHLGGEALFTGCFISANTSPVSDGIYKATGGAHASFLGCTISSNLSRQGTFWFDSTLCSDDEYLMLSDCVFDVNQTIDGQYGATAYCTDGVVGRSPLLVVDRCQVTNSNEAGTDSGSAWYEKDVKSNYYPDYRVLRDISVGALVSDSSSTIGAVGVAANADAQSNGIPGDFNGDGVVDGIDLATLLAAWSS